MAKDVSMFPSLSEVSKHNIFITNNYALIVEGLDISSVNMEPFTMSTMFLT